MNNAIMTLSWAKQYDIGFERGYKAYCMIAVVMTTTTAAAAVLHQQWMCKYSLNSETWYGRQA